MTANQISYAIAQETKRHNEEAESLEQQRVDETVRHDKVTESLTKEANDLSAERLNRETIFNEQKLQHQKEIDHLMYEMQKSQGDRRNDLQEQYQHWQAALGMLEQSYKTEMAILKQQEVDTQKRQQAEIELHNRNMENLQHETVELQKWQTKVQDDYNRYKTDVESGLRREEIQNVRNSLRIIETRDIMQQNLESMRLSLTADQTQSLIRLQESSAKLNDMNRFFTPIKVSAEAYKDVTQGLKNNTQVGVDIIKMLATGGL